MGKFAYRRLMEEIIYIQCNKLGIFRNYSSQFATPALNKGYRSPGEGKEGIVASAAYVGARMDLGSALARDYRTGFYLSAAINLQTQIMGIRIPAVFCTASASFSRHINSSA